MLHISNFVLHKKWAKGKELKNETKIFFEMYMG